MSTLSRYLTSQGLDPFFAGLICGVVITLVFLLARKGGKRSPNVFVSPAAGGTAAAPPPHGAITKNVHFSVRINGEERKLPDDVTASVVAALKSGNQAEAVRLVQETLALSPGAASSIVEALKNTHLS